MPLHIAKRTFECFIVPTISYGAVLWHDRSSTKTLLSLNTVYAKFLKRYLGIPVFTNNAITHLITSSVPLEVQMMVFVENSKRSLQKQLNRVLQNYAFDVLCPNKSITEGSADYYKKWTLEKLIPNIPSEFWRSRIITKLPTTFNARKKLCLEVLNMNHKSLCTDNRFHVKINAENCFCVQCDMPLEWYHLTYMCDPFKLYPEVDVFS